MEKPVYYADYLQLDKITRAQDPESFKAGKTPAHDEMLLSSFTRPMNSGSSRSCSK